MSIMAYIKQKYVRGSLASPTREAVIMSAPGEVGRYIMGISWPMEEITDSEEERKARFIQGWS